MALSRWPFETNFNEQFGWPSELLRSFAPFFNPSFDTARASGVFPPVNVFENGEAYLVRAELPGVDKDSLDISVKGDELTLRGERKVEAADASANYHRRERSGGQFRRALTLPKPVDVDRISASYKHGVLEILLPWVPEAKPRKIDIH